MDPPAIFYLLGFIVPVNIAGFCDWCWNLVPNAITLPLMLAGMVHQTIYGGLEGLREAFPGGFAFFIFGCFLYRLGGIGGGDDKLMIAIGCWLGAGKAAVIVLAAAIIGIVWGLYKYARMGILRERLQAFLGALYLRLVYGTKPGWSWPRLPEDVNAPVPREAVPFGTCLAVAATLLIIVWGGR
ncbi:leader peptidase (prepilin peptidase) / N-methyltransferase [Thermanaeromonas toyohensis ToBE]|uniref:Leader peptidase (Prepilin peptidase) / N-methyltransferase n=1 Tax=Thermanaeromonas toyohensis ToBE TaxID=698762 RepID=A0A1W1VR05_9FIRM|nr:A24 family peptidase [Thermanaeromonas toyohensis]SMB95766.1 leader peptidase (prepilin peptidase) / N-methyltransferase [Thermanaeromonas toyohensis ToBE]